MSIQRTAAGLASLGRNGDTMLLHVSPREVEGLRALGHATGRRVTTNPHTGLPEAFDFTSLIPIVAGIGGTILSGGNVGVGALAAGAASAGTSAAKGESAGTALTKGLVSGLTSYAGGSLLSGVGEAAGEAAGEGVKGALNPVMDESLKAASLQGGEGLSAATDLAQPNAATEAATKMNPMEGAADAAKSAPSQPTIGVKPDAMGSQLYQPQGPTEFNYSEGAQKPWQESFGDRASRGLDQFTNRAENIYNNPGQAANQFVSNVGNDPMKAAMFAGGMYAQGSGALNEQKPFQPAAVQPPHLSPDFGKPRTRELNMPGSDYQPGTTPEFRYFAHGGEVGGLRSFGGDEYGTTANLVNEVKAVAAGEHPHPKAALARARHILGDDVVDSIQNMYGGGRIRGSGGGLDDLVPGTIEGKQKVRLADGEFVLPAHIVSAIGDGSTDQGVRRLHEMMRSIYKQKYKSDGLPKRLKDGTLLDE